MARGDFWDSLFGKIYSAYMPRTLFGRPIAWVIWGGDSKRYYESMTAIDRVPDGGTIVDCPCGARPTLRELDPGATSAACARTSPPRCCAASDGKPAARARPGGSDRGRRERAAAGARQRRALPLLLGSALLRGPEAAVAEIATN
jgi:hypothetical protein